MKRSIYQSLLEWKSNPRRKSLLLRGARQVGKSYVLRQFGELEFRSYVEINFEKDPQYQQCFDTYDPQAILSEIEVLSRQDITIGETLLILDEIQECPRALSALRYFTELMPDLHVVGSGSLLEFVFQKENFKMPVGRVEYLYMHPLSFFEYLEGAQHDRLIQYLQQVSIKKPPSLSIHEECLKLSKQYCALGGMPEVLDTYLETQRYHASYLIQKSIVQTYQDDFPKYGTSSQEKYLDLVFQEAPKHLGQLIKYSHLSPEIRSTFLKDAITKLTKASIVQKINATTASGFPLSSTEKPSKFKLLYLDIGLALQQQQVPEHLQFNLNYSFLIQGGLTEQLVGQELRAYQPAYDNQSLFFWFRDHPKSQAEVDYLYPWGDYFLPIEVKSGSTGSLKSLLLFMKEKQSPFGIRISEHPLSFERGILSIPLYMIFEIDRLIKETLDAH